MTNQQRTFTTTPADVQHRWWVVDAEGQTLGRLASKIAPYLTGKNKPIYTPNIDTGDYVVVINCEKIHVTGRRLEQKMYHHHSGYPGGLTSIPLSEMLEKFPERVIESAVKGMLPSNAMGRNMLKKMKVYVGSEHPHGAQQPEKLEFE